MGHRQEVIGSPWMAWRVETSDSSLQGETIRNWGAMAMDIAWNNEDEAMAMVRDGGRAKAEGRTPHPAPHP